MEKYLIDLLFRDLCARLPYGVKISKVVEDYISEPKTIRSLYPNGTILIEDELFDDGTPDIDSWDIEEIKPYLRPMSSMTEEEYNQLYIDSRVKEDSADILDALANDMDAIDWLNKKMFDYRNLIEKGLALEAPEGMYNNKMEG